MQVELLVQMLQLLLINSMSPVESRGQTCSSSFSLILAMAMAGSLGGGEASSSPAVNNYGEYLYKQYNNTKKDAGTAVKPRQAGQRVDEDGLEGLISGVANKYNLDPALLKAVVKVESNFNPQAVSPAGAMGLMQLMPKTAASLGVKDPFDVRENLDGGARYLKSMLDNFQGDVSLALAAYNAGPGAVKKYSGVPPYRETMDYLRKVKESRKEFFV